jgi:hypothetical protein
MRGVVFKTVTTGSKKAKGFE